MKNLILFSSIICLTKATDDCGVIWDSADGKTYTSRSVICWRVSSKAYNYHCWDERTCQTAESDPSNPNSGWSQNGICAQTLCEPRPPPPPCVQTGRTCAASNECCADSVCRNGVCSSYLVSDNMILYDNFRLKVTPFIDIFEYRVNGKVSLHHSEETERALIEQYASEYGLGSPSIKRYPIAASFEYGLERTGHHNEFIDFEVRLYEQNFNFAANAEVTFNSTLTLPTDYQFAPTSFYPYMTNDHRMNSERQRLYIYERNVPYQAFLYPNIFPVDVPYPDDSPDFTSVEDSIRKCVNLDKLCGGFSIFYRWKGLHVDYHHAGINDIRKLLHSDNNYTTILLDFKDQTGCKFEL